MAGKLRMPRENFTAYRVTLNSKKQLLANCAMVPRSKSSEGLLGGRVFSRTHLRSSLTPEEGPSCLDPCLDAVYSLHLKSFFDELKIV